MKFLSLILSPKLLVLAGGLLLLGCNSTSHSYLLRQDLDTHQFENKVFLNINIAKDSLLTVSSSDDLQGRLALSDSLSSAYNATPAPPGAGPGEMVVAHMLTTYLMKSSIDVKQDSQANLAAEPLYRLLATDAVIDRLGILISSNLNEIDGVEFNTKDSSCCSQIVHVTPQMRLMKNHDALEVTLNYKVVNQGKSDSVFQNSFIYRGASEGQGSQAGYWAGEGGDRLFGFLDRAYAEIAKMIDYEMSSKNNGAARNKTIKYRNGLGQFYERGSILWRDEKRIVIRDLRGNIRSFDGVLM